MEQKRQETIKALRILEAQCLKNQTEGIPLVALHTDCGLKFAQDALALLTAEPTSSAPVGTIKTDEYFLFHEVGDGKTNDGKEYKMREMFFSYTPYVLYKGKSFVLTWTDIVTLAERAGLFNDEVAE